MLILIKTSSMIPHQDHGRAAAAAQMDFAYTTPRSRKKIEHSVDEDGDELMEDARERRPPLIRKPLTDLGRAVYGGLREGKTTLCDWKF